jgi:hypothetical protein
MKSEGGATMTLQPDGSILAGGTNPDRGAYTITARADLARIRAIQLEALPDVSLPQSGPGRHPNGNFHLNVFRVFSGSTPATLAGVFVTYNQPEVRLLSVVDGTPFPALHVRPERQRRDEEDHQQDAQK